MRTSRLLYLVAASAVLLATLAPAAESRALDADALHMLEELERLYSQAGRPRSARSGESPRLSLEQELRDTLQLLQLRAITDRYKSRPRVNRRGLSHEEDTDPEEFESALKILQLHSINRYHVPQRPRFGKRSEDEPSWPQNTDNLPLPGDVLSRTRSYESYRR